jgi:type II secretory pathway component PulM
VIPCRNFWDVAHGDEFLGLSSTKLVEFISSNELQVEREETVFQAVIRWLNHNPEQRRAEFHKVYTLRIQLNVSIA